MTNYNQFHDGLFEGFRIDNTDVHVYLTSNERIRFVANASGVVALNAGGFRAGNIVLEVLVHDRGEITTGHIAELYDLPPGANGELQAQKLMAKVSQETLSLLEINPSYGGNA